MSKRDLIRKILKMNPQVAYNFQGEYIESEFLRPWGNWTRPYAQYVNNNSVYHGIDGGPSPIDIWDYKFSWNVQRLRKATIKELEEMIESLTRWSDIWAKLCEKYSGINIIDFLNHVKYEDKT